MIMVKIRIVVTSGGRKVSVIRWDTQEVGMEVEGVSTVSAKWFLDLLAATEIDVCFIILKSLTIKKQNKYTQKNNERNMVTGLYR